MGGTCEEISPSENEDIATEITLADTISDGIKELTDVDDNV